HGGGLVAEPVGPPPLVDVLRVRPRLPHQLARGIEHALDEDHPVRGHRVGGGGGGRGRARVGAGFSSGCCGHGASPSSWWVWTCWVSSAAARGGSRPGGRSAPPRSGGSARSSPTLP